MAPNGAQPPGDPPLCRPLAGRSRSLPTPRGAVRGADAALIAANSGAGSWQREIPPAGSDSPREARAAQLPPTLLFIPFTPLFPTHSPPHVTQTSPFPPPLPPPQNIP